MKLPLQWAQDFAPFTCTPEEFADRMTMSGSKVETWTREADAMQNVVIGRVAAIERHPDSDHLWVCRMDVGEAQLVQIVTGAQNLSGGEWCPVALHGAKLPNGQTITKGKLRGVESNGMLCSLAELCLAQGDFPFAAEDGILVLTEDTDTLRPGMDAAAALGMDDVSVEFEITPNRPDCLSVRGLAREAAATFGVPFTAPEPAPPAATGSGSVGEVLSAKIEAAETCLRYAAAVVDNVRIAPSPRWLRERLRLAGVRPINNIVDITNYVMLEYGQPMHAFDYAYVNGAAITVRLARPGETIVTLDDAERALDEHMMVIADEKGPIAVAGVMGGEYSGVYETTTRVVFESACFDGPAVRGASRRLGLRTESSTRFEKGLNPDNALPALLRALELVAQLDAGDIVPGVLDEYPAPRARRRVPFRVDAINQLLGISLARGEMEDILRPLGFGIEGDEVLPPTDRYDVSLYNDLAEEVARFVGYNNIPSSMLVGAANARPAPQDAFYDLLCATLAGYGFWECETFSFYSPRCFDMVRLPETSPLRRPVRLMNPLGEETSVLRTTALPSMMEVVARNWAGRTEEALLFELATEYRPAENPDDLPHEGKKLVLAAYGDGWDYLAMKGVVEGLLATARIDTWEVRRNTDGTSYHPGRCADWYAGDVHLGTLGEIHPAVAEAYGIKPRVVAAEVNAAALFALQGETPQFRPLPKYPAITRDLAVVADETVPAAEVAGRIHAAGGRLLESFALFDVYTGESLGAGKKSLAYSLVLRDGEATLTDESADAVLDGILKSLAEIGVELRR